MSQAWLRVLAMCALTTAGCARAAATRPFDAGQGGGPISDADAGMLEDAMAGHDPSDGDDAGSAGDGSGDGAHGSGDGSGGAGSDAGGDPSGGGSDAGAGSGQDAATGESCPAKNTCETAQVLSGIDGDVGTPVATAQGMGSAFLQIELRDKGGEFNASSTLKTRITLTSPTGSNYDLFVRRPDATGGHSTSPRDCNGAERSSQLTVGDDFVIDSWPDKNNLLGQTAGDGLILSIEVRHVSGSCSGTWSLKVEGNVP